MRNWVVRGHTLVSLGKSAAEIICWLQTNVFLARFKGKIITKWGEGDFAEFLWYFWHVQKKKAQNLLFFLLLELQQRFGLDHMRGGKKRVCIVCLWMGWEGCKGSCFSGIGED